LAAACKRGDFLAGFSLGDAPDFDDWVALQREVWHRRLGLILDRLSEIQFARGEFAGATETAAQWIALDNLNEIAYRRKMRAHFAAGERGQALDTYEACHAILKTELGIEPEPDTSALVGRIRSQPSHARSLSHYADPGSKRPDTSVAFLGNMFAGRVAEHQSLVDSYARAAADQPQLVVLHGGAGIGKTRLARKFLAWAKSQSAELLQAGNFESSIHIPFQPLIDALRGRLEHENSPQDLLDEMWLSPLSQLLPELRQGNPGLPPAPQLEANGDQTQFYEPLTQYTLALAKQAPLVLFVDDLQWTDSATLGLLQYTIRRWQDLSARVLLLVSLRSVALHPMTQPQQINGPRGLGQWLRRLERELTPVQIELKPLEERDTIEMILSILSPPDADFAQWLYDETRGHPFYLIETLKDLLERQVLRPKRQEKGQWVFVVDAEHDLGHAVRVPSTVHTIIRARLNRLSPNAFSLLACGAVLERQITFEYLCNISNVSEDLALPALDELITSRLLLETAQSGDASEYAFENDMLRDVVYTEAGDARRRLFHRRALEVLEADQASSAVLAHHALAAGLAQAAFHHSLAAGRESLRISAVSEAIVHLEFALGFVQEASQQEMPEETKLRDLYLLLGRAYKLSGQNEKALQMDSEHDRLS
jgi:predicted ATPase